MAVATSSAKNRRIAEPPRQYGTDVRGRPLSTTAAAAECFHDFARDRPEMVAMWAFGLGFILGWKLRLF